MQNFHRIYCSFLSKPIYVGHISTFWTSQIPQYILMKSFHGESIETNHLFIPTQCLIAKHVYNHARCQHLVHVYLALTVVGWVYYIIVELFTSILKCYLNIICTIQIIKCIFRQTFYLHSVGNW